MQGRERAVAEAFVFMATTLADGYELVELLDGLTANCAALLDVAGAGLLLANSDGNLQVMSASSDALRELEVFQLQMLQGPCVDCFKSGSPVLVADLVERAPSWPRFALSALTAGFWSVHAVPLRVQQRTIGVVGLFGTTKGSLNEEDLRLAQALADVASVAITQDRLRVDSDAVNHQLQTALDSRIVLEQAKGIVAQHTGLDMPEAFQLIRRYSRDRNLKLHDVAASVVARGLVASDLLGPEGVTEKLAASLNDGGRRGIDPGPAGKTGPGASGC